MDAKQKARINFNHHVNFLSARQKLAKIQEYLDNAQSLEPSQEVNTTMAHINCLLQSVVDKFEGN